MKTNHLRYSGRGAVLLICVCLAGCATMKSPGLPEPDDPLEPLNRAVLDTNTALDDAFIRPIAEAYRAMAPQFLRDRIRAAIDNLAEPRIFVNDVLQGRPQAARVTLARFFINTTVGVAGTLDVATDQGYPRQSGDFGQTLYAWGVDDGPYLVLLLLGPSNLRDALGFGVDVLTTPPALVVTGHAATVTGLTIGMLDGIDLRARNIETLDEIKASALDYYAHLKSIVRQRRHAILREARGAQDEPRELTDPERSADEPQP